MNRLPDERRADVVRAFIKTHSGRWASRVTGTDKDTAQRILVAVGDFCLIYMCHALRNRTGKYLKKTDDRTQALRFMLHNYCRPHAGLTSAANGIETTPAMAAGLADHVWSLEEILGRMERSYLIR